MMNNMAKFYTPEVDSAITNVHINIEHLTYFTTTKLDDGSVDVAFYFGTGPHRSTPPTIKVNIDEDDVDYLFSCIDRKSVV